MVPPARITARACCTMSWKCSSGFNNKNFIVDFFQSKIRIEDTCQNSSFGHYLDDLVPGCRVTKILPSCTLLVSARRNDSIIPRAGLCTEKSSLASCTLTKNANKSTRPRLQH